MKVVVIGSLNTDIAGTGFEHLLAKGEYSKGDQLLIGPGGKSRNIASMIATYDPAIDVSMLSLTVKDSAGMWKYPYDALVESGVRVDHVTVLQQDETSKMPAVALIPVDVKGNNQIYLLPGISAELTPSFIDSHSSVFKATENGVLILTLEMPYETAIHAARIGKKQGYSVMLDPGGIEPSQDISELLRLVDFVKPNEHEAKILTGVDVVDMDSAKVAAEKIREYGIRCVLITCGGDGAYLFSDQIERSYATRPIPGREVMDETGCGDQAMAVFCVESVRMGHDGEAAIRAVDAGTLQFHSVGIKPIKESDLR